MSLFCFRGENIRHIKNTKNIISKQKLNKIELLERFEEQWGKHA